MRSKGVEVVESNGAGRVVSDEPHAAFVPMKHDESELGEIMRKADRPGKSAPSDVVFFAGNVGGRRRDVLERAKLWARVRRRVVSIEYDKDAEGGFTREAKVPVAVAAEGKPTIAAYLAAHNHSNDSIADALGVGNRTISQYISDFKKGER